MTSHRPWLPLFVAGCLFSEMAGAQNTAGDSAAGAGAGGSAAGSPAAGAPAAGSSTPGGASSAFGAAPSAPSSATIPNAPSQGATPNGTQNPNAPNGQNQGTQGTQGTGTGNGQPAAGGQDNTTPGGSASAFGSTEKPGASQLQQAPATFTVPGFYGRGPQSFTVGEGRLARPRSRLSWNISAGYDDNVFATPTHAQGVPTQKVQVEVAPGTPATQTQVLVPSGDPTVPSTLQTVQVPAVPPKFQTVTIRGVPPAQRIPSWVTRTDGKWDVQFASRKTLFTFDLGAGLDYYWDRPGKKEDYTGSVSMVYLRKLSNRAQFTFSLDSAYQSQPDFSQPNVPTSPNVGSYLSANAKMDLQYRFTQRFSMVASATYSTLQYQQNTQTGANYATTTFGTQLRYLISPRLTLLGELRYSSDMHPNDSALDTSTYYLLIGGELQLSRRFNGSLRLGEQVQRFKTEGGTSSAPYGELAVGYRFGRASLLAWNARYGYEEAGTPNSHNIVARTGLQLTEIITPRFQSVLSVNLVRSSFTSSSSATGTSTTSSGSGTATSSSNSSSSTTSVTDTIDASLGFYYTVNRHWSYNLTYSYTMSLAPINVDDYFRQRIFLGASYQF